MRIHEELFEHPVQASRVRLNVFEQPEGYLVTEERIGAVTVVATLGVFQEREAALERARLRAGDLIAQRYSKVTANGVRTTPAA
jgi:hypothetical protein